MSSQQEFRIEKDSMGEVRVPAVAKWRAQTQRAVENFPISGQPIERELIVRLHATTEDVPKGCVIIDATAPIERVVDEILEKCS